MSNSTSQILSDFLNHRNRTRYQRYVDNSTGLYNLAQFIDDQKLPQVLDDLVPIWDLQKLVMDGLRVTTPNLEACDFSHSRCFGTVFEFNEASQNGLPGLQLRHCDLTRAEFHLTTAHPFTRPSFQGSTLVGTRFFGNTGTVQTCMHDADFRDTLIEDVLFDTQLVTPNFRSALLTGPQLNFALNPQGNCQATADNFPTSGCAIANFNMEETHIQGVNFAGRQLCYGTFNSNTTIEDSNFLYTRYCLGTFRYKGDTNLKCVSGEDFQQQLQKYGVKERNNLFCDGNFNCRSTDYRLSVVMGGVFGGFFFLGLLGLMIWFTVRTTKNQVTKYKNKNHLRYVKEEYQALSTELAEADAEFIEKLGKWQKEANRQANAGLPPGEQVNRKLPRDVFILICDMYTRQDLAVDTIQEVDTLSIRPDELPGRPARILRFFDTPRRHNLRRDYRENVFNELYPPQAVVEFDVESGSESESEENNDLLIARGRGK